MFISVAGVVGPGRGGQALAVSRAAAREGGLPPAPRGAEPWEIPAGLARLLLRVEGKVAEK